MSSRLPVPILRAVKRASPRNWPPPTPELAGAQFPTFHDANDLANVDEPTRSLHAFLVSLLDKRGNRRKDLAEPYDVLKDHGQLRRLLPAIPRYLAHLQRSLRRPDHERLARICLEVYATLGDPAWAQEAAAEPDRSICQCRREPLYQDPSLRRVGICPKFDCSASRTRAGDCPITNGSLLKKVHQHRVLALASLGRPADALRAFENDAPTHPKSTGDPRTLTAHDRAEFCEVPLCAIMASFATAGYPEHTISVFRKYQSKLHRSGRAISLALKAMFSTGDVVGACTLFKETSPEAMTMAHYNMLMSGLLDAGAYEEAKQLYEGLMTVPPSSPAMVPDAHTHTIALKMYLAQGDVAAAMTIFRSQFRFARETVELARNSIYPAQFMASESLDAAPDGGPPAHCQPTAETFSTLITALSSSAWATLDTLSLACQLHYEMLHGEHLATATISGKLVTRCLAADQPGWAQSVLREHLAVNGPLDAPFVDALRRAAIAAKDPQPWIGPVLRDWLERVHPDLAESDKSFWDRVTAAAARAPRQTWRARGWHDHWDGDHAAKDMRRIRLLRRRAVLRAASAQGAAAVPGEPEMTFELVVSADGKTVESVEFGGADAGADPDAALAV
ncbi:hypothetical protein GGF32_009479 [Allomyces javanicus]|nr:hypothetical protein GGF32_009479 [Allomyces javanicus]